jgi:hypothetical protein
LDQNISAKNLARRVFLGSSSGVFTRLELTSLSMSFGMTLSSSRGILNGGAPAGTRCDTVDTLCGTSPSFGMQLVALAHMLGYVI